MIHDRDGTQDSVSGRRPRPDDKEQDESSGAAKHPRVAPRRGVVLHDHQHEHVQALVARLQSYGAAVDSSPTGTGKTFCAMAVAERMGAERILVVSPIAVEDKWRDVLSQHSQVPWNVVTYSLLTRGATRKGVIEFGDDVKTVVVTYRLTGVLGEKKVTIPAEAVPKPEFARVWCGARTVLILDEMHNVKNMLTQAAHGADALIKAVRQGGGWVMHLSATPADRMEQLGWLFKMILRHHRGESPADVARKLVRDGGGGGGGGGDSAREEKARAACEMLFAGIDFTPCDAMNRLATSGSDTGDYWGRIQAAVFKPRLESVCAHFVGALEAARRLYTPSPPPIEVRIIMCVQLPLAVTTLGSDAVLALDLLLFGLPHLICRMEMPRGDVRCFNTNLFLEDADVGRAIIRDLVLPTYCSMTPYAPLASPGGRVWVSEEVAMRWREREWRLGEERPVDVWRKLEAAQAADSAEFEDARAAHVMCVIARDRAMNVQEQRQGEEGGDGEDGEEEERNVRVAMETIKVSPLARVVTDMLRADPSMKVTVMFNYLSPLRKFVDAMRPCAEAVVLTGGATKAERKAAVLRFNTDDSVHLLCCTIQMLSEGVDLHDTRGDSRRVTFIMACPSVVRTHQAQGRIFRVGVMSHAVNCVVFGGYAAGGSAEQQLLIRLASKRGTVSMMQKGENEDGGGEWHNFYSSRSFIDAYRAAHGEGTMVGAHQSYVSSLVRQGSMSHAWYDKEVSMRMWQRVRKALESEDELLAFARQFYDPAWDERLSMVDSRAAEAVEKHVCIKAPRALEKSASSLLFALPAVHSRYLSRTDLETAMGKMRGMTFEQAVTQRPWRVNATTALLETERAGQRTGQMDTAMEAKWAARLARRMR